MFRNLKIGIRLGLSFGLILVLLRHRGERPVVNRDTWLLGLTGLALFYFFYSYGLRHTTAANTTLISGGTPVIVALLAAIFLGERVTRPKGVFFIQLPWLPLGRMSRVRFRNVLQDTRILTARPRR